MNTSNIINLQWFPTEDGLLTFLRLEQTTCKVEYDQKLELLGIHPLALAHEQLDAEKLSQLLELNILAFEYDCSIAINKGSIVLLGKATPDKLEERLRIGINLMFAVLELFNIENQHDATQGYQSA